MYPKVLILSDRFHSGDAITAINLFSKWKRNCLFCASRYPDYFANNFSSTYLLGSEEIHFSFPLNLLNKLPKSTVDFQESAPQMRKKNTLLSSVYLKFVIPILWFFNLFSGRVKYKVSTKFLSWIDSIKPDYIYTSIGSLDMAYFVHQLMLLRPSIKLIYHGYDDWVNPNHITINNKYSIKASLILSELIKNSSIRWTVSQKMAEEYEIRYNQIFEFIPNPSLVVDNYTIQQEQIITFIGKVGFHNKSSIRTMAKALKEFNNKSSLTMFFHIYSDIDISFETELKGICDNCIFHSWVDHSEVANILNKSRILYLPISTDKATMRYTKYSMSTKMSEYLASNATLLYLGPDNIAMTDFLETNNCAFVLKEENVKSIVDILYEIISTPTLVNTKKSNAKILFNNFFDIESVTSKVYNSIIKDYK